MSLTKPYEKYFAIQKECYTPYFTECCLLDDYNDLTEEQQDFLDELEAGSVWAVSLQGQNLFRHMERNHPKKLHSWSSGDIVSIFTTSGSLSGLRFLLFFIVFFLSLFEIFICNHSMQKKYHVGKLLFSYISLHTSPCPASAFAVHLQSLLYGSHTPQPASSHLPRYPADIHWNQSTHTRPSYPALRQSPVFCFCPCLCCHSIFFSFSVSISLYKPLEFFIRNLNIQV